MKCSNSLNLNSILHFYALTLMEILQLALHFNYKLVKVIIFKLFNVK